MLLSDWGIIDYEEALKRQEKLFNAAIANKQLGIPVENELILCEHPSVYTLGKNGHSENMLFNPHQIPLIRTNRGGDITYHGPGQIVGYPIFDLETLHFGLKSYIYNVEKSIIEVLAEYGITATRLAGATGVWIDGENPAKSRKICAIGIRCSHFVTMHGFALNVNTDLNHFKNINPCGFTDKGVTSMQQELGTELPISEIRQAVFAFFLSNFR
ncbi:MAG: lipoyl(octanoyl) transferase LipB [Bacteroidota bacterium]|jgi:lipoyl(octanoyl) transferase|nr:lipoyl(octanoyl) transferase LipB [Paludibacteraceae bacterium]MDI9536246.1 lipoyl(octanoyl) transferase LipB [Bacteroidota bacterium]HHT60985.1 lipoyl(octanoyl) transferase LipB [Bacteroidales bacterium]